MFWGWRHSWRRKCMPPAHFCSHGEYIYPAWWAYRSIMVDIYIQYGEYIYLPRWIYSSTVKSEKAECAESTPPWLQPILAGGVLVHFRTGMNHFLGIWLCTEPNLPRITTEPLFRAPHSYTYRNFHFTVKSVFLLITGYRCKKSLIFAQLIVFTQPQQHATF